MFRRVQKAGPATPGSGKTSNNCSDEERAHSDGENSDSSLNNTVRFDQQANKRLHTQLSPSSPSPTAIDNILLDIQRGINEMRSEQKGLSGQMSGLEQQVAKSTSLAVQAMQRTEAAENKLEEVNESIASLKRAINDIHAAPSAEWRDDLEREKRCADIIIRGIPVTKATSRGTLRDTVLKISKFLGVVLLDRELHYVRVQLQHQSNKPSLIARFATAATRDAVLSAYFAAGMRLSTKNLGLSTDSSIYLSDNLMPAVVKLKAEARKLKDNGTIKKISTRNGLLSVVTTTDPSKWHNINSYDDIQRLTNHPMEVAQALGRLNVSGERSAFH